MTACLARRSGFCPRATLPSPGQHWLADPAAMQHDGKLLVNIDLIITLSVENPTSPPGRMSEAARGAAMAMSSQIWMKCSALCTCMPADDTRTVALLTMHTLPDYQNQHFVTRFTTIPNGPDRLITGPCYVRSAERREASRNV